MGGERANCSLKFCEVLLFVCNRRLKTRSELELRKLLFFVFCDETSILEWLNRAVQNIVAVRLPGSSPVAEGRGPKISRISREIPTDCLHRFLSILAGDVELGRD